MRFVTPLWSLAILAPLVMAPLVVGGLLGAIDVMPSLTTLAQVAVAALSVFAVWAGLSRRGH